MLGASTAEMTASMATSHWSEILRLRLSEMGLSLRQTMTSGWIPAAAQLGDRVLRRLRLLLPRDQVGHQGQVDVADVVAADVPAELPDGLNERHDLDVADGPADLDDDDVDVLVGQALDPVLDLVGDVGDDLDGPAQEVAAALLRDDGAVDAAGGRVGAPGEVLVDEALVVAEVEVGLAAVLGDEDLAVLPGVHGARDRR